MTLRKPRVCVFIFITFLCFYLTPALSFSQEKKLNLNTYYRYLLSVGIEYQIFSPFAEYGSNYNIFEVSANVRWPIPPVPVLQPMVKGGMIRFDNQDQAEPTLWDHTHAFGGIGLVVAHRFAKTFEISGEAAVSFSQSFFPNLLPEAGVLGEKNLIFEAGAHIDLNPSYNFNISVHPNVKYLASLGAMKDFNSFIFGIGFSANFRIGSDPDAPAAIIRSIQFTDVELPPLFAAMQSYYVRNPIGTIHLSNTDKKTITDVQVSFFQNGYMDSPTNAETIPEIEPGKGRDVDLFASFNEEVFQTEGITPLTGEVIVTYFSGGKPAEQRQSVSYDLYDKTSVTWDDDQKVSAFITPADSALRNYSSFIRQTCKDVTIPYYNKNLQFAIQAFHALNEIGVLYQIDPTLPFTEVQGDPMVVDSISLPRDTLKRITGDCDDLTVLFCSLLESVGIETGFITVPGHIYAAFNTKEETKNYDSIHPDRNMMITIDGNLWVPVEITMIGSKGFLDAWRKGIEEWLEFKESPEKRGFYITKRAQETYRPVGLKETDLGLQYGSRENITSGVNKEIDELVQGVVSDLVKRTEEKNDKKAWNRLGVAYAKFMRSHMAKQAFERALDADPDYISAAINLANLNFLDESYEEAREVYDRALITLRQNPSPSSAIMEKLLINLSRTYYQLERYDEAKTLFAEAEGINPDVSREYSYIAQASLEGDTGRAAEADASESPILFIEEGDEE